MIRPIKESDFDTVINIVNENWKLVYKKYINPYLISDSGCKERIQRLKNDFHSGRLGEYVWEENGQVIAMLSIGDTADNDKLGDFEIWRIYVNPTEQRKGIGGQMLAFSEQYAKEKGYTEVIIWAFKENIRAISFYEKHGYRIDKEEYLGEPCLTYGTRLLKSINDNPKECLYQ